MITFQDLMEKKVSAVQRRKQARRMAKFAKSPTFQKKKQRALIKFRTADKIDTAARKKTINRIRKSSIHNIVRCHFNNEQSWIKSCYRSTARK